MYLGIFIINLGPKLLFHANFILVQNCSNKATFLWHFDTLMDVLLFQCLFIGQKYNLCNSQQSIWSYNLYNPCKAIWCVVYFEAVLVIMVMYFSFLAYIHLINNLINFYIWSIITLHLSLHSIFHIVLRLYVLCIYTILIVWILSYTIYRKLYKVYIIIWLCCCTWWMVVWVMLLWEY